MNRVIRVFLVAAVVVLICGCKSKKNTPEDAKLKGNVYTNRFFGFGLQIPKTWTFPDILSKRQIKKGVSLWGFDKEVAAAAADAVTDDTLLLASELSSGMSLAIMAEDVSDTPDIRTGKDYLDEALQWMTGEGRPFQQVGQAAPIRLADRDFYGVKMTGAVEGRRLYQGVFVTIEKGYALVMMAGAKTENGVDEVLRQVGLKPNGPLIAQANPPPRKVTKVESPEPEWVSQVRLQGISGSESRRFAIINGKTFAAGDTDKVKTSARTVTVRCLAINEKSVTVTMDGVEGEWELQLVRK